MPWKELSPSTALLPRPSAIPFHRSSLWTKTEYSLRGCRCEHALLWVDLCSAFTALFSLSTYPCKCYIDFSLKAVFQSSKIFFLQVQPQQKCTCIVSPKSWKIFIKMSVFATSVWIYCLIVWGWWSHGYGVLHLILTFYTSYYKSDRDKETEIKWLCSCELLWIFCLNISVICQTMTSVNSWIHGLIGHLRKMPSEMLASSVSFAWTNNTYTACCLILFNEVHSSWFSACLGRYGLSCWSNELLLLHGIC